LPNQIEESIKKRRSKILHSTAKEIQLDVLRRMVGQTHSVLWEGQGQRQDNGALRFFGYTPNYHKAFVDIYDDIKITNQIIDCEIGKVTSEGLLCVTLLELPASSEHRLFIKQL